MKTWVEQLTCDFCVPLFKREKPNPVLESDTERVPLPEGKTLEGEMCPVCKVQLLEDWYSAWRLLGRDVDIQIPDSPEALPEPEPLAPAAPPAGANGYSAPKSGECLWPGCDFSNEGKSPNNFGMHIQKNHGLGVTGMFGLVCPVCGHKGGAMLGRHTKGEHGLSVAGAFQQAAKDGDQFGIVAKQRGKMEKQAARVTV